MAFAYGKVNIKDVFLQYDLDEQNFLRGGYFIHQYGYQSCTSSSFKETMEESQSNAVFNNDRMMGLMFELMDDRFLATASVVVETDAMKQTTDVTGNEAVGAMSRLLYHSFAEPGKIFHVGVSGGIEGARYDANESQNHKQFTLSTSFFCFILAAALVAVIYFTICFILKLNHYIKKEEEKLVNSKSFLIFATSYPN